MSKPKAKVARALGIALTPKAAKVIERRPGLPGQHGMGRRKSPSVYKLQLLEKQKLKAFYNISEAQLRKIYSDAHKGTENTGDNLLILLESRADAAVFRMGFARTIFAARQYVAHGHFEVNGKRIHTPSIRLKVGDILSVRDKSKTHLQIVEALTQSTSIQVPGYLELNKVKMEGKLAGRPSRDQIPVPINPQLVVEYYSR